MRDDESRGLKKDVQGFLFFQVESSQNTSQKSLWLSMISLILRSWLINRIAKPNGASKPALIGADRSSKFAARPTVMLSNVSD